MMLYHLNIETLKLFIIGYSDLSTLRVASYTPQTIGFIQYNRPIHSYKRKFRPLRLWIHCSDQSDIILTFQLVVLHDYVISIKSHRCTRSESLPIFRNKLIIYILILNMSVTCVLSVLIQDILNSLNHQIIHSSILLRSNHIIISLIVSDIPFKTRLYIIIRPFKSQANNITYSRWWW